MAHYKNMRAFMDALNKMEANVRSKALRNAVEAGARVVEGHAKVNIVNTFKKQTGNLAASVRVDVTQNSDQARALIGPTAIYGRIQELGGTVKPLTARMLFWTDENGKSHAAHEVTLPARPYLKPAMEDNEDAIVNAVAENLRIEIEGAI